MAREATLKQGSSGTLLGLKTTIDLTGNDDLYIHFLLPDNTTHVASRLDGASVNPTSDVGGVNDGAAPTEGIVYFTVTTALTALIGKVICTARVQFTGQDLLSDPPAILQISGIFDNAGGA